MSSVAEDFKPALEELPERDRAELAQFLLRTLDREEDSESESACEMELARREAEILEGKVVGEPAESVFARLRERYP